MTLKRWLIACSALYLLPLAGMVPLGSTLHALCVLPLGLTLLLLIPGMLVWAWSHLWRERRRVERLLGRPLPKSPVL